MFPKTCPEASAEAHACINALSWFPFAPPRSIPVVYFYSALYNTIVKDYVREQRLSHQEMFVPLFHPAGNAQVDFGEAEVIIGGLQQTAHFFVLDLPHSDDVFVVIFP